MKKNWQILLLIIAAIIGLGFFYWQKPQAKADQVTNIAIEQTINQEIRPKIQNLPVSFDTENATIKITTKSNDWPENWSGEAIFSQNLDLKPESFGKFFQGPILGSKTELYLAWNPQIANTQILEIIKKTLIQNPPKAQTILVVGDIMLGRDVDERMDRLGRTFPFEKMAEFTKTADLTLGNLESPFKEGQSTREAMVFGAEKASIEGLKLAGFDLLNLANNHFGNQGQSGMNLTFDWLKENKIAYFGAGRTDLQAHQPLIQKINNQKIAFLGYTDTDVIPNSYQAKAETPGVAAMNLETLAQDVKNARQYADLVIVSMHGGYEYTAFPSDRQREFAHLAIDSGADLIIGHHPHVVQGIENYKGKFIVYSLGNFIFDQPWSEETQQGMVAKFTILLGKIVGIELTPIRIYNWSQPQIVENQKEYEEIFTRIFAASEKLRN